MAITIQALVWVPAAAAQPFGEWSPAVSVDPGGLAGVNTASLEGCPIEAPDGHMLFFASNRAGSLDIWVSVRASEESPWDAPERLPAPVNLDDANDFCPTPLPGNALLFVSNRSDACGGARNPDIFYTRFHPVRGWLPPQHLGCEVNSEAEEFSPSLVEAQGVTMLFFSSNRAGVHDIFMSVREPDGTWSTPEPVDELNSAFHDARPNVRKDGLEIVFDSSRDGGPPEIYTATRASIFDLWSTPERLDGRVNSPAAESRPTISRDGTRLYFGSTRNAGQSDLYVSTRAKPGMR